MNRKRTFISIAVAFAVAIPVFLLAQRAEGSVLSTHLVPNLENSIEDTNFDRLLNPGFPDGGGDTILEIGDTLEAIVTFNTLNGTIFSAIPGMTAPYQLTAYTKIIVATKVPGTGVNKWDFTFKNGIDADTAVQLYENSLPTAAEKLTGADDATGTAADGIARATSGTLLATVGINSLLDFWVSDDTNDDISLFAAGSTLVGQGGNFSFGLSLVLSPGLLITPLAELAFNPLTGVVSPHDIVGDGDLHRLPLTAGITAWQAQTNTEFFFTAAIPEPMSLAVWMGLGVASLVVGYRRRVRKAA